MQIGQKIKLIREAENIKRSEFCQLIDMTVDSLKGYEVRNRNIGYDNLIKITHHPRFEKYSLWLVTDKTSVESGQISPDSTSSKIMSAAIPEATLTSAFEQTMHTSISLGWLTPKDGINFEMLSDVFLADFEKVGGQTLKADPLEPSPQVSSSKT